MTGGTSSRAEAFVTSSQKSSTTVRFVVLDQCFSMTTLLWYRGTCKWKEGEKRNKVKDEREKKKWSDNKKKSKSGGMGNLTYPALPRMKRFWIIVTENMLVPYRQTNAGNTIK